MSNGFFYAIHDDDKAPSWAFYWHGHRISRPVADLLNDDGRALSWALHGHGHLISRTAADFLRDNDRTPPWALHGHRQIIGRPAAANLLNHDVRAPFWSPPDHGHLRRLCSLVHLGKLPAICTANFCVVETPTIIELQSGREVTLKLLTQ